MTQTLISTAEINGQVKGLTNKIFLIRDLIELGFKPVYTTKNAAFWEEDTGKKLETLLKKNKKTEFTFEEEINMAITQGYKDGYKDGRKNGIESGMRNMHSLLIEYLMDTHSELVQEIQYVSDGFLRPIIPAAKQ